MAFQLSPGVNVSEIDLTTVVPAVATSDGAFAGVFRWGPIGERVLIDSENLLVNRFGKPTNHNAETFFTAANFLAYANRLYVSRAAKTSGGTPTAYVNSTAVTNATVFSNVFTTNTSGLEVGMYVTQASNTGIFNPVSLPSIVSLNSSSITLSSAASINTSANVQLYFSRPDTTYSAVGTESNTAVVANLVNQIVKNENDFVAKEGNFDLDVLYVARYPGALGNSLRVAVCDTANSFSSNLVLPLGNLVFEIGSTVATLSDTLKLEGAAGNTLAYTVATEQVFNNITTGDYLLVGNSSISTQYMLVTNKNISYSVNNASIVANVTIDGSNAGVNSTSYFITANNIFADGRQELVDGDAVVYANAASNTAIGGLTNGSTYYIISSNTTGFKVSLTSGGDAVAITNTATVSTHTFTSTATVPVATISNINASSLINETEKFILVNNQSGGSLILNNGDYVVYANGAGNTAIGGLFGGSTYLVAGANSTGFKLATGDVANVVTLSVSGISTNTSHTFTSNTTTITVSGNVIFQDPYRLRERYSSNNIARYWEFFNSVESPPGQSDHVRLNGNTSAQDELHVIVVDDGGGFSGTPGTILEVYKGVSRATDAKNNDGSTNYYKDVINDASQYIWLANDRTNALSNTSVNVASATTTAPANMRMRFGSDGLSEETATLSILGAAYDLFVSPEDIDISLILQGKPIGGTTVVGGETISNYQLANYIIDNICEVRKDCVALISPDKSKVLNNIGSEALSLKNWRGAVRNTSYAVLDSGYKYQYDRYNDIYRWIPLNGDIAGLCVRTDNTNDAWWSPAGFNRGNVKNVVKLAYNPRKSERDVLYSNGVNPVVTFPGQGTVLFGDKTLQAKPSAFDRINVRRLFIVLEKAISTSAKFSLFEFNDAFTRAQFKNLVTPYLRNIQGRRGITDFLVVCDETNNTAQVIDSNQFVGDIYIKPARSINFIQLNFVAVGTGVQFSEVVGKF